MTTTIHTAADGIPYEIWQRGGNQVCIFLGRDAGRKKARLKEAGFSLKLRGRADDVGRVPLNGDWMTDNYRLVECAASGPNAEALIRLAHGEE